MEDNELNADEVAVDVEIKFAATSASVSDFRCTTHDTINININGGIQND